MIGIGNSPASGRPALLLGATSVLGYAIARRYGGSVIPVGTPHRGRDTWRRLRYENADEVAQLIDETSPALVIYGHAVCDVEKCESHPNWARRMIVDTVANFLDQLPPRARFVYLSSDHVFGGDGTYTESAKPSPISAYGRLRIEAEGRVAKRAGSLILRHGLPIGESLDGRTGFRDWLRYREERGLPITLIRNEYRSAVCATALADRVMALARSELEGVRHIPATACVSRPDLAAHLFGNRRAMPSLSIRNREEQPFPHLGRVQIASEHNDALAAPLPSYVSAEASRS